ARGDGGGFQLGPDADDVRCVARVGEGVHDPLVVRGRQLGDVELAGGGKLDGNTPVHDQVVGELVDQDVLTHAVVEPGFQLGNLGPGGDLGVVSGEDAVQTF